MRVSRRAVLRTVAGGGAAGAGAVALDGFVITPNRLDVSRHVIGSGGYGPADRATAARGDVRVAHVSDLHLRAIGAREEAVLGALADLAPDVIAITGDSLDAPAGAGPLGEFLAACPAAAARLAILGNWEYKAGMADDRLRRLHERHGFELLVDRSVVLRLHGHDVRVTGLDDLCHGSPDAVAALGTAEPGPAHLILAHCPATRDTLRLPPGHAADAILSGHTHGGQVSPAGVCLLTPYGSGRYVAGWYAGAAAPMFVSRGIGTSLLPVRLGAAPELAVIDWRLGRG